MHNVAIIILFKNGVPVPLERGVYTQNTRIFLTWEVEWNMGPEVVINNVAESTSYKQFCSQTELMPHHPR